MDTDIVATLTPSPVRRIIAVLSLAAVALMLLWIVLVTPPSDLGWLFFLVAGGLGLLWLSWRLWTATEGQIVLTRDGLFDSSGRCLTTIDNIKMVERGPFAFKPSGGFAVQLKEAPGRGWSPGMWWRFGRRLGVGGVTPVAQSKVVAESIILIILEKNNPEPE
ncbi:hypothetical protein [Meridianimarinicoccus aquatilis]|uniref:Uncharacterized protein n=1 Tax=Meridianimarinicoccus aquatilis TaxID=2552766 RepID=A0A4R6AN83_9RHOB|nr:hypothetical protein [Fluviibacterium aquatile]TDL85821.1 hypothetical protein E2L05_14515 [Fluviibacterium aquatile]